MERYAGQMVLGFMLTFIFTVGIFMGRWASAVYDPRQHDKVVESAKAYADDHNMTYFAIACEVPDNSAQWVNCTVITDEQEFEILCPRNGTACRENIDGDKKTRRTKEKRNDLRARRYFETAA